jgi:glycosyltransferase involved in cell wall biosynthesis
VKIALCDNNGLKFCSDLIPHWTARGHEVRYERGASEFLAQWADIYYIEWIDGNLNYLLKLYADDPGHNRTKDWDNNKKPKIICRMIDWDIWCGYVPFYAQEYINFIDKAICIAPHIEKYILEKALGYKEKLKLIRPGVNLDKFPLKTKKTDGFQLGMALGDFWPQAKNHMGGLDIFTTLYNLDNRWRLHIRGQHEHGEYWPYMYEHYLNSRGIRDAVTLYAPLDDMNVFYENIDILLHPGMKEGFCYSVAEAMVKGIPVVCNQFYGSENIWPQTILYKTHLNAVEMISGIKNKKHPENYPQILRKYIEDTYNMERMLNEFDEFIGL